MRLRSLCGFVFALALSAVPVLAQGSDDCSAADLIVGAGPHTADLWSTSPSSMPAAGCTVYDRDVWFEWSAPTTDLYSVTACGNTWLAWSATVWDGCGGNVLACGAHHCHNDDNKVVFQATAGTSYWIQIAADFQVIGSFEIEPFFPNPHDECSTASSIAGFGDFAYDRSYATSGSITSTSCGTMVNDVWMEWVAPFDRYTKFTSNRIGILAIYHGGCAGQVVACDTYSSFNGNLELGFMAEAGETYMLQIGSTSNFGQAQGTLRIESLVPEIYAGTGNAYMEMPVFLPWADAKLAAESMMFRGVAGHLATIGDVGEGLFLGGLTSYGWSWMGLFQDHADPSYSEPAGGWKWVTGEPLNYTQWQPPNRPDDFSGEDAAVMYPNGNWEDSSDEGGAYFLVEWELNSVGDVFCDNALENSTGLACFQNAVSTGGGGSGVRLEASDGPPGQIGYFLAGTGTQAPGISIGQGLLCLGISATDQIGRYNVFGTPLNSIGAFDDNGTLQNLAGTSAAGSGFDVPMTLPVPGVPLIQVGETWHFQLWHRDAGGTSNFSNGTSVTF